MRAANEGVSRPRFFAGALRATGRQTGRQAESENRSISSNERRAVHQYYRQDAAAGTLGKLIDERGSLCICVIYI